MLATRIIQENIETLNEILDQPHGGTLAHEEIAEMMLSQYIYDLRREDAATTLAN